MSSFTGVPRAPTLQIETRRERDQVVIALRGELDLGSVDEVERAVAAQGDTENLTIDLTELEFIDSTGLRLLLRIHASCEKSGRELKVRPGPPAVHRVFELTHIDNCLPFADRG